MKVIFESRYYKASEICQMMGITAMTLINWVKLGKVPQPLQIGATRLYEKEAFDSFLKTSGDMAR